MLLHCLKCIEKEIYDLQKEAHMCAICNLPIQVRLEFRFVRI